MNWRFTIIDRDNVSHVISEPVGWDAMEIEVKRDDNTHGIVFDYQNNDLKYHGQAKDLLKTEYDTYGSQGSMVLVIEEACDGAFEELYRGKFLFGKYVLVSGPECYVKIPIENSGDVIELTTKFDQKVNLNAVKAFDGVTDLVPYDKLNFDLTLPSKGILLQDYAKCETASTDVFDGLIDFNGTRTHQMDLNFQKVIAAEIGSFKSEGTPLSSPISDEGPASEGGPFIYYTEEAGAGVCPYYPPFSDPIINLSKENPIVLLLNGNIQFDFSLAIQIIATNCIVGQYHLLFLRLKDKLSEVDLTHYDIIYENLLDNFHDHSTFNYTYTFTGDITPYIGDRYYLFLTFRERKTDSDLSNVLAGAKSFTFSIQPGSYFKATSLSKTNPTIAKVCFINETISRIVEGITNNNLKAYSEYFGRTDSQPYSHEVNGIGSLEALTKGIYIRNQQNRIVGQPNVFSLSLKDIWEGLEPIHHIGYGIEADTNREGYKRLRIEPWHYFYQDAVVMECIGVDSVEKKMQENKHYSTFKFGYEKYEAEQYNGLDEFLTKRTYRTTLNGIKNELSKLSKFIASGYAWEITRRKSTDSSDWRFDNDTFIICLAYYGIVKTGISDINFGIFGGNGIELMDALFIGLLPLAIGDVITITNSVNNPGPFTIFYIGELHGTYPILGKYRVQVGVTPAPVPEYLTNGVYTISRKYLVEMGNVDTPTNIIDPDTLYNYRISPIRNALRWMDKIAESYKANPSIIFTDGDGNYHASGKMLDSFGRLENTILAENNTLTPDVFANAANATPILAPELITFDYPMSVQEFKNILASPYGKIYWNNGYEEGYGYIDVIKYKPEEGKANFTLIPKI